MIDQKSFSSNVGIVGSGRSIFIASQFLLHVGLARTLSIEGYGSFQQVYLFNVLFLIFSLGIPETINYFLPRIDQEQRGAFLGQTILLLSAAAAILVILLGFGAPFLAGLQGNQSIELSIRFFGIYGACVVLSSVVDPIFIYYRHMKYIFFLSALHGLFFVFLIVWRTIADIPIEMIFAALMVFGFFKCLIAFSLLKNIRHETGRIRFSGPRSMVIPQVVFALPLALHSTIDGLSRWLDKIVVSFVLGTEPLGLFSVGAMEIPFVSVFAATVYSLVSPKLNELEHAGDYAVFSDFIGKLLTFTAKFIWPLAIYLFVFADHLVPFVFTDAYGQSVLPFRIYLAMMPLRICMFGVIIVALGNPRIVLIGSAGSLAINLILNIIFIKWLGFIGPAIATVISTYLQVIFLFGFIVRRLHISPFKLVPVVKLAKIALASFGSVALAYFLTYSYMNDLKAALISLTISTAAYIFLGARMGLFRMFSLNTLLKGQNVE